MGGAVKTSAVPGQSHTSIGSVGWQQALFEAIGRISEERELAERIMPSYYATHIEKVLKHLEDAYSIGLARASDQDKAIDEIRYAATEMAGIALMLSDELDRYFEATAAFRANKYDKKINTADDLFMRMVLDSAVKLFELLGMNNAADALRNSLPTYLHKDFYMKHYKKHFQ